MIILSIVLILVLLLVIAFKIDSMCKKIDLLWTFHKYSHNKEEGQSFRDLIMEE